ncbi:hypothetical protein Lal_00049971 [Lupinus albus]|uniref:Putative G-patch domain, R3H domain-containing protein n=1 Tax=Lupinus albus TaxID=3870 RepID=A0A6A4PLD0_LUPAL|nr:putative G-patch domain, R3H domain-containing protein [Lupinus albus]KAF1867542.1 hypothetical protein Lal_00049971 [Lupinus albus]
MGGGSRRGRSRSNNNRNRKNALFIEGGFLSDWHPSSSPTFNSSGGNSSSKKRSGSKSGRGRRAEASASKIVLPDSSSGATIGYSYPSSNNIQVVPCVENNNEDSNLNKLQHFVSVDSKQSQVIAHVDQTPSSKPSNVQYTYSYGSDFVLGDSSHKGLDFSPEHDNTPSGIGTSSDQMPQSTPVFGSSSFMKDVGSDEGMNCELVNQMTEELPSKMSAERNSGFLSIGGLKLYTEDISDNESEEEDDNEMSSNEDIYGSSESEELVGSSESDDSEDTSDSDSDIDEEVAEDYLEGVGGSDNIIDAKYLLKSVTDESDDDGSSSSCYDEALEKLSGIALQEASREYGMKKSQPWKKRSGHSGPLDLDDLMLEKDPRTTSRKKHVSQFPRSWPLQAQKSKASKRIHGEKKKLRKEKIAVKRRERMLHRGVDLEKINLKLQQLVLEQVDIFSFQPMHSRDCSQVQRVAAIYNFRSSCQSFGKKRFVTVMRTQSTSMPSSSGRQRLEKLMGADDEDADFAVSDYINKKHVTGDRRSAKRIGKRNEFRLQERRSSEQKTSKNSGSRGSGKGKDKKGSGQKAPLSNQPVSFVSSGLIHSETVQITAVVDTEENDKKGVTSSANIGSFEIHTTGFGSKMLAKMGYMEGAGLGINGQGMAEPIEVIRRPKSLGLGVEFSHSPPEPAASEPASRNSKSPSSSRIGGFEKHTKGFGSKMMAKMGFIEGTGLGRDSQGITNPLSAVRLPKSRGLGSKR